MAWFWVAAATRSMHRQVGQECLDLRFGGEEIFARPHAVETDESDDPLHIGALGVNGVVVETEHLAHFIKEFRWLTSCCVRHTSVPSWRPGIVDNRYRAKLPENPSNITLSGQNDKLINGSAFFLAHEVIMPFTVLEFHDILDADLWVLERMLSLPSDPPPGQARETLFIRLIFKEPSQWEINRRRSKLIEETCFRTVYCCSKSICRVLSHCYRQCGTDCWQ